ncbi:M23 family metallopeptidase [Nocardioides sp. W3-2-3]|uniref:M23 family metallopeptidase n=1 Tax=Nocardioides convexus TaxID=2712224 RepID=UPI00241834A7|nr:M23 family metallopeptidase [Nocardioides convexus]NHA01669.1 M23 family metallopeptidase [Nocardioides convexus]
MGSHRADHRAPRPGSSTPYAGKRVAQRTESEAPSSYVGKRAARPVAAEPVRSEVAEPVVRPAERTPTVEPPGAARHRDVRPADRLLDHADSRPSSPPGSAAPSSTPAPAARSSRPSPASPSRSASRRSPSRSAAPSSPRTRRLASAGDRVTAANAVTGSFGNGSVTERVATVSRDSERDTLAQASGTDLVAEAERSAQERNTALDDLAKAAEKEAAEIALNRWVLPLHAYRLTAKFGEYGLWSNYHTGLDFAAPVGTPIYAVTNGTVSSAGFDGAYGNKTVITLDDGTEFVVLPPVGLQRVGGPEGPRRPA